MRTNLERVALNITKRRLGLASLYATLSPIERIEMDNEVARTQMFGEIFLQLSFTGFKKKVVIRSNPLIKAFQRLGRAVRVQ